MKRTRAATGSERRVLRRKNIVHDEDESEEEEEDERMSGGEDDEEDEEEDEEEEDEEEEEEEDEEEEEEAATEEEQEATQSQRRRTSDRIKNATPPPKKKQTRGGRKRGASEDQKEEDDDEDDETPTTKNDGGQEEQDDEEEEEKSGAENEKRVTRRGTGAAAATAKKPPARPASRRGPGRRNTVEEEDEDEEDEERDSQRSGDSGKSIKAAKPKARGRIVETAPSSAEEEGDKGEQEGDDNTGTPSSSATPMEVENDDTEETKSDGTPMATPSASPVRRAGLSMEALVHSTPVKGDAGGAETETVPFQHFREQLRTASTEQETMEAISWACSSLIKDNKPPNRLFSVALLSAVKETPSRFEHPTVLKYLLRLLRSKHYTTSGKDTTGDAHGIKKSGLSTSMTSASLVTNDAGAEIPLPVVIANALLHILKDAPTWPEDSFKVFLDDSLHSRVWVDHEFSRSFVRNVKSTIRMPEEAADNTDGSPLVRQRGIEGKDVGELRDLAMKHIRLRLNELEKERSSMTKVMRTMALALIDFVSIPEARVIAAENLDTWLQNPSMKGPARELLTKVVAACTTMDVHDLRTVDLLLKLKLKPTMFQVKVETITQLVRQHGGYLRLALNLLITRERPNNMGKDVDNMKMLHQIFRSSRSAAAAAPNAPDEAFYNIPAIHPGATASRELGFVFRDLASSSELASGLKTMVRKIVKQLGFDNIDMKTLCVDILRNDEHWDALAKYADMRLLDYMALVTGTVWLVLSMRGAAVKSLQIQQTNAATTGPRQDSSGSQMGGVVKLGNAQAIPRRSIQSVVGGSSQNARVSKLGGSGFGKNKVQSTSTGKASPSSVSSMSSASTGNATNASGGPASTLTAQGASTTLQQDLAVANKAVKIAVKAKEELQQTLAYVQRQALVSCHELFQKFGLSGKSSFEKSLYECIVKRLLFLEIPPDVQPTEHDKTCFLSTKENIPLHPDSLELLTTLLSVCESVDRVEVLRTLEAVVFRAAEGHMQREALWGASHADELAAYSANGGVVGIEVTGTAFIDDLLRLTVWKESHKLEHEFCYSSRFWICCSILLIVGSFNPTTVGDILWRGFPTVRAIMQMLITGRFEFPSVSGGVPDPELFGGHRENFIDLLQANAQLCEYEQHVMVTVAPTVDDPLMLFEIRGVARQPPPAIIEHLKVLDRKFRLGIRLRQSRTKDFLMEMVADGAAGVADGGAETTWWITDIVCEDFDTVQYLPHECLCRLLLLARRGAPTGITSQGAKQARRLAQVAPRLQRKLHEFLVNSNQVDTATKIILYYLECLVSGGPRDRRVASQILFDLTRDPAEQLDSASSTPKSESDVTMDDTASSTLRLVEGMTTLDDVHASMNFEWLGGLLKLPCYSHVREKAFSALELLLDRESNVASLSSCIKALHAFWKDAAEPQSTDNASSAAPRTSSKNRVPLSGAAADASVQLAGTFGRLLSTREFVARHLLQLREMGEIFAEIFWSVIAVQLRPDVDRSGKIRFSDCKVFYATTDGSTTVREIKLPLPVIHGAIRMLCAPRPQQGGSVAYEKLSECLFPKVKKDTTTAILSSTGVIATKDRRLYPTDLLKKMVQFAGSSHLVGAAAKATPPQSLWELLQTSGLTSMAQVAVARTLGDLIRSNESAVVAAIQTVSKQPAAQSAAAAITATISLSSATEHERFLIDWLKQQAGTTPSELVSNEEEALLSSGFASCKVSRGRAVKTLTFSFDDDEEDVDMLQKRVDDVKVEPSSDWTAFKKAYPSLHETTTLVEATGLSETTLLSKAAELVIGPCVRSSGNANDSPDAEASAWSRRIVVLHCLRGACHSSTGAIQLGNTVLQVLDHVATCRVDACVADGYDFIKQTCEMVAQSFSLSAAHCFIQQATRIAGLVVSDEGTLNERYVHASLIVVLHCFDTLLRQWHSRQFMPTLSPLMVHNVVALMIDAEVMARTVDGRKTKKVSDVVVPAIDNTTVLARLVEATGNQSTTLVLLLDALLSADGQLASAPDFITHHREIRREHIEALYFSNPRDVALHLQVLDPSWKQGINPQSRASRHVTGREVDEIDKAIHALKSEHSDAVDRLRELSIRDPVLVQHRILRVLQEWKGDISLTLLYQKSGVFQMTIRVIDMWLPSIVHDSKAMEAVVRFVFDILETISTHQAAEFYQLVARLLAFVGDALGEDVDGLTDILFTTDRLEVLRSVTIIYESVAEIATFAGVLEQPYNRDHLSSALQTLASARNKTVASSEDQRQVRSFLERVASSPEGVESLTASEIETALLLLLQVLGKAQEVGTRVPLLVPCAEPMTQLLHHEDMSKAAIKTLCQVLLSLIKHDPAHAVECIISRFVQSLGTLRLSLRETVLTFVTDFLVVADNPHRQAILKRLYEDTSDFAKSKLVAIVKSAAFKTNREPFK